MSFEEYRERLAQGDGAAWRRLVSSYSEMIKNRLRSRLPNHCKDYSEDITQELFRYQWDHRRGLRNMQDERHLRNALMWKAEMLRSTWFAQYTRENDFVAFEENSCVRYEQNADGNWDTRQSSEHGDNATLVAYGQPVRQRDTEREVICLQSIRTALEWLSDEDRILLRMRAPTTLRVKLRNQTEVARSTFFTRLKIARGKLHSNLKAMDWFQDCAPNIVAWLVNYEY